MNYLVTQCAMDETQDLVMIGIYSINRSTSTAVFYLLKNHTHLYILILLIDISDNKTLMVNLNFQVSDI